MANTKLLTIQSLGNGKRKRQVRRNHDHVATSAVCRKRES